MTKFETYSIWISLAAFLASAVAIWISVRASNRAQRTQDGMAEMNVHTMIETAKDRVHDIAGDIASLPPEKERSSADMRRAVTLNKRLDAAMESYLNAMEEACAKYHDNKIDRKRFREQHQLEVRRLANADVARDRLNEPGAYPSILKTLSAWKELPPR